MAVLDLAAIITLIEGPFGGAYYHKDLVTGRGTVRPRRRKRRQTFSPAQLAWHEKYRTACYAWVQKTPVEQMVWRAVVNHPGITGCDVFMSAALSALRDGLPIPETPRAGAGCNPHCPPTQPAPPLPPAPPEEPEEPPPPPPNPWACMWCDAADKPTPYWYRVTIDHIGGIPTEICNDLNGFHEAAQYSNCFWLAMTAHWDISVFITPEPSLWVYAESRPDQEEMIVWLYENWVPHPCEYVGFLHDVIQDGCYTAEVPICHVQPVFAPGP